MAGQAAARPIELLRVLPPEGLLGRGPNWNRRDPRQRRRLTSRERWGVRRLLDQWPPSLPASSLSGHQPGLQPLSPMEPAVTTGDWTKGHSCPLDRLDHGRHPPAPGRCWAWAEAVLQGLREPRPCCDGLLFRNA